MAFRRAPEPFQDPVLGTLTRSRGWWRGQIDVTGHASVPLAVPGSRSGPDPAAVECAHTIPQQLAASREELQAAFDDHREPYVDDMSADSDPPTLVFASVIDLDGERAAELGWSVPWDEEHIVGARLRDGRLVELNGSVLEP